MLEKAIRLAAFYKFTHVALEFWGQLRPRAAGAGSAPGPGRKRGRAGSLRWRAAWGWKLFPCSTVGPRQRQPPGMGGTSCWDQNPRLAPLFEPDGWTWCLSNPRTQALPGSVCDELIAVAGPGRYFHIGCAEAYSHATCDRCRRADPVQLFAGHVNQLAAHLEQRGRRAIMWGDALLEREWPGSPPTAPPRSRPMRR